MRQGNVGGLDGWADGTTCSDAMAMLQDMGIDTDLIEWPSYQPGRTFYREAMNDFATEVETSAR